ncbi:hypothetical protein [Deinococcus radiophilus]|uniref:hypothetical protein n=1 Tax=Deinococcus radiophilus TaxID=32062 RepID=UPI00360EBAB3
MALAPGRAVPGRWWAQAGVSGPKDMAELLDWLLDANLSLLPGPVGERLLAELRGL